eukprot:m.105355 g.105355  ORF g.105355 m.105355 type:complete len:251 (+) comp15708_c0_seq1:189-941(+)
MARFVISMLLAATVCVAHGSSAPLGDILWLPLGDSITFGCGTDAAPEGPVKCEPDNGGYRVPLAWALTQAGWNVSTMGTLYTGPDYVPAQWKRHEGHPGWRFDQIDALLNRSLASSPVPPTHVTIHLGTNDCGQTVTQPVLKQRATSLLDHLLAAVPDARIYVASMIGFPREAQCVDAFNAWLPGILTDYTKRGMHAVYVPMQEWSGVCSANATSPLYGLCCSGQVHPTAAGYLRMASAFALAINENQNP